MRSISRPIIVFFTGFRASQKWMSRKRNWVSWGPRETSLKNMNFSSVSDETGDFPFRFIAMVWDLSGSRVLVSTKKRRTAYKGGGREGGETKSFKEVLIDWYESIECGSLSYRWFRSEKTKRDGWEESPSSTARYNCVICVGWGKVEQSNVWASCFVFGVRAASDGAKK